jgi:ketosteroid isomerase-like protein
MKVLALVFLLIILTTTSSGQSERQASKIRTDILAVMDAQTAAWNRGDIDVFMRGYLKAEKLIFASGDTVTRGWQTTLDRYKKNYSSKEKMGALRFGDIEITVISKDAAVVLGSWSLVRANDNPKGKFTLIFRKTSDGWRIVHDHTS